jgi:hypothetical protein
MNSYRWLLAACGLALLMAVLLIRSSKSQAADWVAANGSYTGRMAMVGFYTVPEEAFGGAAPGAEIFWGGNMGGPLEIHIDGGIGSGTWQVEGGADIFGTFPAGAGQAQIVGAQTMGAEGELYGNFAGFVPIPISDLLDFASFAPIDFFPIQLFGSAWTDAEITITVGDQSNTKSHGTVTEDVDTRMYYQVASCTQLQGGWVEPAEARLEETGIRPAFWGSWSVVRDDALSAEFEDFFFQEMDLVINELLSLRTAINNCEEIPAEAFEGALGSAHEWLQSLQMDVSCDLVNDPNQYLFPVTNVACTTISAYYNSTCPQYENISADQQIVAISAIGMGCMGWEFFADDEATLQTIEDELLDVLAGLDLSQPGDAVLASKIIDVANTLGFDNVVEQTLDALERAYQTGEGD